MTPRGILLASLMVAVVAAVVTAQQAIAKDSERAAAADRRETREADRDAVLDDVQEEERYLKGFTKSLGRSAVPVRDEEIRAPTGVEESLLTGDIAINDFHDVVVDEGIVLRGISVKEVDELPRRDVGTLPPKPQKPLKAMDGYRLLAVELEVTNRSGSGADPACGISSQFSTHAIDDKGENGVVLTAYDVIGTYPTACSDGMADGTSARIILPVGLREGDRLAALEFAFLGEGDSDSTTQALVLEKPV